MPRWLGSPMFNMVRAKSENDKYAEQVRSSAGVAVFVLDIDDKTNWIEAGRCYERFALKATELSIRNAMLNQTVEPQKSRQLSGKEPFVLVAQQVLLHFAHGVARQLFDHKALLGDFEVGKL